jgi:hypothetical protein
VTKEHVKIIIRLFSKCRSGGDQLEDVHLDIFFSLPFPAGIKSKIFQIFSSLPFPAGTVNIPKNVMKNDDFYRAENLKNDKK